ncbi:MAG: hypothetical protein HY040_25040 [Planctomycetes bacterium]|nr:hypothetical protein [Planctomycetota bacterium]
MNSKILCGWLGLPDKQWPPDHYALLGLKQGESDLANIEKTVQERMSKLRCYQLSHPEEATEGMNRVAQAFITLMEAAAKAARRAAPAVIATARLPQKRPGDSVRLRPPSKEDTLVGNKTEVDWKNTPPPVRAKEKSGSNWAAPQTARSIPMGIPVASAGVPSAGVAEAPPEAPPASTAVSAPAVQVSPATASLAALPALGDSINITIELAQQSPEARRGLGTLPALIERIYLTRHLLTDWKAIGRYMSQPRKRPMRTAEEVDLTRRMRAILQSIDEFPPVIGHPGKPGYRVVAMAHLGMTAQMLQMLDDNQRDDLARDWQAGHRLLVCHRQFLRWQFKTLRTRGRFSRTMRGVRAKINDHPGWVIASLLLAAGVCAACYLYVF